MSSTSPNCAAIVQKYSVSHAVNEKLLRDFNDESYRPAGEREHAFMLDDLDLVFVEEPVTEEMAREIRDFLIS